MSRSVLLSGQEKLNAVYIFKRTSPCGIMSIQQIWNSKFNESDKTTGVWVRDLDSTSVRFHHTDRAVVTQGGSHGLFTETLKRDS